MITRFAPSPTGPLHLGHVYSALLAHDMAAAVGGQFLLRIEDIDRSRARQDWEVQIFEDLHWLGLSWPKPVMRQSDQLARYSESLAWLRSRNHVFSCTCSRRDVLNSLAAPQEGAEILMGPDGIIYPGTCRNKLTASKNDLLDVALRLSMSSAVRQNIFSFQETGHGPNGETGLIEFTAQDAIRDIGDIVLSRRDMGTSYHLSVVLDDAAQGITHVVRGEDLFEATKIHIILQKLIGLPTPIYHHHNLIRDDTGKRLAKRDNARAIAKYRAEGVSPNDVRLIVGL
ncbi:MAG: glutamyl-Q tRNA(Asp) synthetase [Alteromonas macleodii]|jgi:glutamyl-Q tRNA(Asp) synthetase